jgi:uncharacterized BrkB/YihY/UPF0761 family membrane protein
MIAVDTAPAAKRPVIVWDVIVTIVLLVGLIAVDAAISFAALFLVMMSDSCGTTAPCNDTLLTVGWLVAVIGPSMIVLATIVVAIIAMVRRRLSFWMALTGAAVALGVWGVGVALVYSAVPGSHP